MLTTKQMNSNPELLARYMKWKEDPTTKMVQELLRSEALSSLNGIPTNLISKGSAEMLLGQQCGSQWAIERIGTLDNVLQTEELVPDYGAAEILKTQRYGGDNG